MSNTARSLETLFKGIPLGKYDRRKKLSDKDKEDIRKMYKQGESIHAIARAFEGICSRRMIQFVIYPERDARLKAIRSKEKGHLKYYDKDKHREAIKQWRRHKKQLFKDKKI